MGPHCVCSLSFSLTSSITSMMNMITTIISFLLSHVVSVLGKRGRCTKPKSAARSARNFSFAVPSQNVSRILFVPAIALALEFVLLVGGNAVFKLDFTACTRATDRSLKQRDPLLHHLQAL